MMIRTVERGAVNGLRVPDQAADGGPVDVLVAASDAPTARAHRLDASLLFARPTPAAL